MIQWSSFEFHYYEKNKAWPVLVIIGAMVISAIALWQRNLLFVIFTVIATSLMIVLGRRKPRRLAFMLNKQGLCIEDRVYPFHNFSSFALYEDTLLLHHKSRVHPYFSIVIPQEKSDAIRGYLLEFLPEVKYTESFIEAIGHWLKF